MCLSYQKSNGSIRVVKDGKAVMVHVGNTKLTEVQIPGDFLTKVYLGRCSLDYKNNCSAPEGKFTDFNVWDRALPLQEMMDWTECK